MKTITDESKLRLSYPVEPGIEPEEITVAEFRRRMAKDRPLYVEALLAMIKGQGYVVMRWGEKVELINEGQKALR
jgi:hypothetical protein